MAIKRCGRHRKEKCDWCSERASFQIVTSVGIKSRACLIHLDHLRDFNKAMILENKQAEDNYRLRSGMRSDERSIAEFQLNV